MAVTILTGDCRVALKGLPAESVHCCVTSPPYYNLRNYGCDGQIGLEASVAEYVAELVGVFREVKRVLRSDATLWLNLGDAYASSPTGSLGSRITIEGGQANQAAGLGRPDKIKSSGLKPKDLIGLPWRVAFALQADGWYLRSEIIWAKSNPMPESVKDRPTRAHETVFLLSKGQRYFYDADAVAEPCGVASGRPQSVRAVELARERGLSEAHLAALRAAGASRAGSKRKVRSRWGETPSETERLADEAAALLGSYAQEFNGGNKRNLRSVWTIPTQPFSAAKFGLDVEHFATFPPKLVEPCIKAGTSEKGCCPGCGAPWARMVEREPGFQARRQTEGGLRRRRTGGAVDSDYRGVGSTRATTTGWRPTCSCDAGEPVPCRVLDVFGGAGTTGLVAQRLGRNATLIELNPNYAALARARIDAEVPPLLAGVAA